MYDYTIKKYKRKNGSIPINTGVPFRVYRYFIIILINNLYNLLKILKIVIKSIPNLFLMRSPSQINMFSSNQVLKLNINIY